MPIVQSLSALPPLSVICLSLYPAIKKQKCSGTATRNSAVLFNTRNIFLLLPLKMACSCLSEVRLHNSILVQQNYWKQYVVYLQILESVKNFWGKLWEYQFLWKATYVSGFFPLKYIDLIISYWSGPSYMISVVCLYLIKSLVT